MGTTPEPTMAQRALGAYAPKLASLTDDVLFGDVWSRPTLSPRERSLITIASLVTGGNTEQLAGHLKLGRENGLSDQEIEEALTHLAFYAGWPKAMSACGVARSSFDEDAQ